MSKSEKEEFEENTDEWEIEKGEDEKSEKAEIKEKPEEKQEPKSTEIEPEEDEESDDLDKCPYCSADADNLVFFEEYGFYECESCGQRFKIEDE